MPKNKDLKRLIRARMEKTGESYTAARVHLLASELPLPAEYEKVAGMSDAAVANATGKTWPEWAKELDRVDAASWEHRKIADHIHETYEGVNGWWAQMVTVSYERFRGLREIGQRRGGGFDVNKSKTIGVPVSRLYAAFEDPALRAEWLESTPLTIRKATEDKSMRCRFGDDTPVDVYFTAKGDEKSSVSVQHRQLADKERAEEMKAWWGERLEVLKGVLGRG